MYDPGGTSFDYANVIYAVLQDCEHRRRSFSDGDVEAGLIECAKEKLGRIRTSYLEGMGSKSYWRDLEKEVLSVVMPQYIPAAIAQNAKERTGYGVFRGGDLLARALFALIGLTIGGIIVAVPFIPIFEKAFAFVLAGAGWFYSDMVRMMHEYRHYKLLNRLVTEGETTQRSRSRYMSTADVEDDDEADKVAETATEDEARRDAARRAQAAAAREKAGQ